MEATLDTNEVREWKRYDEYREIDTAWVTTAPEHWEFKRLKWTIDGCQNGIWGGEPTGEEGEDLGCVRVADFDRDNLVVTGEIELTMRSIPVSKREGRQLVRGDLLLEKSGGGDLQPVGAVVLFDSDAEAVCSNFVAKVSVPDDYSSSFLRYLHAGLYAARVNTRSLKQSTGIQNLDSGQYFDEKMALPPHAEQQAIAAFLDRETARIDALIGHKERLIALLEEKRQAVISHAVTRGLDPNAKMKDSGIEWLGEVPVAWTVKKLKHWVEFHNNKRIPLSSEVRGTIEKVYPYYGASGIIDKVDDYLFDEDMILIGEDGANLLSRSTPLAFIATGKYWVNNHAHILRPREGQFLYWAERLNSISYVPFVSGSAQPKLTIEALGSIDFAAPNPDEQFAIAKHIEEHDAKIVPAINRVGESIDRLHEYRTALISAAVTGQIDVREEASAQNG